MSYRNRQIRGMTARERSRGRERGHSLRNICLVVFFLAFVFGCYWNSQQLRQSIAAVHQQTAAIEELIDEELEKQIDLKAQQRYLLTDEYSMRLARAKFNLMRDGEHLYVFQ